MPHQQNGDFKDTPKGISLGDTMPHSTRRVSKMSKATCKTCGEVAPNHRPCFLDPNGIGHPDHEIKDSMNTPDPIRDTELEEILKRYSIVSYDNPNGIYASSNNDWKEALTTLKAREERIILEAKAYQIKKDIATVRKMRDIYLLKEDFDFPAVLDDPMKDKVVKNWNALRHYIVADLEADLESQVSKEEA